jgi:hypothetical protein
MVKKKFILKQQKSIDLFFSIICYWWVHFIFKALFEIIFRINILEKNNLTKIVTDKKIRKFKIYRSEKISSEKSILWSQRPVKIIG